MLSPRDVAPSTDGFEVIGTFNPGAVRVGDDIHLLVRVAELPRADGSHVLLPRYESSSLVVDVHNPADIESTDARVVIDRRTRMAKLTSVSHLRHYVVPVDRVTDPSAYRDTGNRFLPDAATETMGVEDPRLTTIDGRHYFTYVSVSRHGACTSVASTDDFESFERHGVQFPNENKDVLLFPERVAGRYAAFHRPVSSTPFGAPEMWTAASDDLVAWGRHRPLVRRHAGADDWDGGRVGGGTVPVRIDDAWVHLYHGNRHSDVAGKVGEYCGALMVNDGDDPAIVRRVSDPVFVSDQPFEVDGFVPRVVFPTAWVDLGDDVAIFYGAADTHTAVAIGDRRELLSHIGL